MVQPTQERPCHYLQLRWEPVPMRLLCHGEWHRWLGSTWPKRHVWTTCIIMAYPFLQQVSQVILGQWNHVIQTFPPERAQQSLTQCVRLRTLRGRFQDLQPQVPYALVEVLGEDAVPVMEEEAVAMIRWNRFAELLERPWRRGMRSHMDMQDATTRMFHHDKDIQEAKSHCDRDTEIARHDRLSMVAHKGLPALDLSTFAWTPGTVLWHVLPHGAG
jgi:hypothetical protein